MKKFQNVPAIITLIAGFVVSVIMIIEKYSLLDFLWILALVMVSFYIAGIVLKFTLNKTIKALEGIDKEKMQDTTDNDEANTNAISNEADEKVEAQEKGD